MNKILSLIVFLLVGCSLTSKNEPKKFTLRILHTNDHHGHYLEDKHGQYGMAARKTLVKKLKAENPFNLLLSGGDINTGTMESDIFDAKPDFLGMKKIGYDAMAVGNHEFDNSFKVLKQQMSWAGFPFLSSNIFYKGTKKRVFNPYIIKKINGLKIGIVGFTTKDTPFKASHDDAKKLFDFISITDAAKEIIPVLKTKVDFIIAVTHVGHYGSATSNGDVDLAKSVDGIDVIVGGHSQEIINAEVHNNTIIVQAEDWGKYVGVLDLNISKSNNRISHEYKLIPVNLKKKVNGKRVFVSTPIKKDKDLEKFFSSYKEKAKKIGEKTVGHIKNDLNGDRKLVRSRQMPIGQFLGASLMYQIKDVEGAVINGGSIRSDLPKGEVSRKKIHNVHPYGNTISTVKFSDVEFFKYMSSVAKKALVDPKNIIGGYPQIINMNLTIKGDTLIKVEAKDKSWAIEMKGGKLISNKKNIVFGTMSFLGKGGDNYPKISDHKTYVDTGFMINAAMMNYVENKKVLDTKVFEKSTSDIITFK